MKYIFFLMLFFCALEAKIIDGVALKVNGNIITFYEIAQVQEQLKLSKEEATEAIIVSKLRENEVRRLGIKVDDNKINDEMNNIIASNGISQDEFLEILKTQGMDIETYKKNLRDHIVNRELMQHILQSNTNLAREDDLRQYYETHKNEFVIPTTIKVTSYISNSDVELQKFLRNPMVFNPNVEMKDEEISIRSLPQQIVSVFLNTPEKQFTPILNSGSTLIVFFIKEKTGEELLPFEEIKTNVMQRFSQAKEEEILKDYFDKVKASSDIEIIREQ